MPFKAFSRNSLYRTAPASILLANSEVKRSSGSRELLSTSRLSSSNIFKTFRPCSVNCVPPPRAPPSSHISGASDKAFSSATAFHARGMTGQPFFPSVIDLTSSTAFRTDALRRLSRLPSLNWISKLHPVTMRRPT